MVEFPSAWVQHYSVNLATAYPPGLGARFRYHERLRPRPTFSAIVQRQLAADPDFKVHQLGEMVRIITAEGEYGAWVRIDGLREGSPAARFVGAVFLEEFATALDVIALLPEHVAAVERLSLELVRSDAFHATQRPRMFFYAPPPGWQAVVSGTTATWYPLDFPNNLSSIVVPAATRLEADAPHTLEAAFAQLGAGLTVETSAREDMTSSTGSKGVYMRLVGRRAGRAEPLHRELAMFVIGSYAYRMRLETAMAARVLELREVLRATAGSFRPLPSPEEMRTGRAFAVPSNVFDYWTS